jgi:hypothetical protein
MKTLSGSFLIALLIGLAPWSVACGSRAINTRNAKTTAQRFGGIDDSSAPSEWKRYEFDKPLAFSLILPNEPEQRVSTLSGGPERSHVYISMSRSGVYGLTYIDDLPAVAKRYPKSGYEFFFETFVKDFALRLQNSGQEKSSDLGFKQFKVIKETQVAVSGIEGLEWNFLVGLFQGRMQMVRVGQAAFCLVAIWKQTASLTEQDAFFNSAKITGEGR